MENKLFYEQLNNELLNTVKNDIPEQLLQKIKQDNQRLSYALLIWFMKFYANIENVQSYITDGHDDNSCDIILDLKDSQGIKTYYLVQSKWNSIDNCNKEFDYTELKAFLADAQTVLRGDAIKGKNELFNNRYDDLLNHVSENGRVKLIYLSLKNNCGNTTENIKSFEKSFGANVKVEGFDINRLKRDYIDNKYKKSIPPNPLENIYNPEFEKIKLETLMCENSHIKITTPFEAHVFTIKPSQIYNLVNKYGVSLFDKNIRNPLKQSNINNEIKSSLVNNPSYFWYYNNGITAITRHIPAINNCAKSFEITGLQVINGAQTAYSVFKAYEEASEQERALIDEEAKITLRLLKSGGKDFDLKVTKFTNSQNPVSERDFWSNDPIQEKIQNHFYNTNIWYERREGEFRAKPDNIVSVANQYVANAFLAFYQQDPVSILKATYTRESEDIDLIFISHKERKDGLYETVFNDDTDPEEMLAAFCMFDLLTDIKAYPLGSIFFSHGFHVLTISRAILRKYLDFKSTKINMTNFITKSYLNDDRVILRKILQYSTKSLLEMLSEQKEPDEAFKILSNKSHFDIFVESIEKTIESREMIESMELIVESENSDDNIEPEQNTEIKNTSLH